MALSFIPTRRATQGRRGRQHVSTFVLFVVKKETGLTTKVTNPVDAASCRVGVGKRLEAASTVTKETKADFGFRTVGHSAICNCGQGWQINPCEQAMQAGCLRHKGYK